MKLSIIIPAYNAEPYLGELVKCLADQMQPDVEVIIVDDGSAEKVKYSFPWLKVIRKKNGGVSTARNRGLEVAKGSYIQFIDADDLVPEYFVEKLLAKIDATDADLIDHSWRSLDSQGVQHNFLLKSDSDRLINPSAATRCFKRSFIGDTRFNEKKDSTEDEDFTRHLGVMDPNSTYKHASMTEYMYFYRTSVENSKVKRFKKGLMNTKRIVYYYRQVTADMTDLLEEIRKEDETNEVWLLTERCEIPELKRYCQIAQPFYLWCHELRGEPYSKCTLVPIPIKTQVVLYVEFAARVGGITTFIYNWCQNMKDRYKILVLYDRFDEKALERLKKIVPTMKNDINTVIQCDTIILNRLTDKMPPNLIYTRSIQMCHANIQPNYRIPQDRDFLVNVSKISKESWGKQAERGIVINNMSWQDAQKCLILVSATRINSADKGYNDSRIIKLAQMLNEAEIPFVWLSFSDQPLQNPPKNVINMDARMNVQDYIARADYLVQLSDTESFCYSIIEALTNGVPVITTPLEVLPEIGVIDGINGHIIPFDMEFNVEKLLNIPKFIFNFDNESRIKQWEKLLKAKPPKRKLPGNQAKIQVLYPYKDTTLNTFFNSGQEYVIPKERAEKALEAGYVKIIGG